MTESLTMQELQYALKKLKKKKSPGGRWHHQRDADAPGIQSQTHATPNLQSQLALGKVPLKMERSPYKTHFKERKRQKQT